MGLLDDCFDWKEIAKKLFVKYKACPLSRIKMKINFKVLHIISTALEFSITLVVWDGVGPVSIESLI